jgi:hypothetical protein
MRVAVALLQSAARRCGVAAVALPIGNMSIVHRC